ncbi:MAG TPA: branched-chain amino acid ABC transporter permease [Burkholderiaceae bacterium]|nr:branched-chain amino acid ABC transporter permease [Burkholderiaceae bacterium]
MDWQIAALLAQDGLTNGAIYALLAIALVMVFAVTRVILIPQGEFVSFGALTLASLQAGRFPGVVWLVVGLAIVAGAAESVHLVRAHRTQRVARRLASTLGFPLAVAALAWWAAPRQLSLGFQVALTLLVVAPLGPLLYRVAFQPLAGAPVLVLLIVSVAVHLALTGLSLFFFGAEGARTPPFSEARFDLGALTVTSQSLWILGVAVALIAALALFFGRTLYGKALRATAFNHTGARLIGFSPDAAGRLSFALAAVLGTLSGILIGPITTIYYDSGFLIGLKGFVAAIVAGLASYPLALAGAMLVGLLESFASFWASQYKEVIVFTLIIPVLLWLSLTTHHVEEDS